MGQFVPRGFCAASVVFITANIKPGIHVGAEVSIRRAIRFDVAVLIAVAIACDEPADKHTILVRLRSVSAGVKIVTAGVKPAAGAPQTRRSSNGDEPRTPDGDDAASSASAVPRSTCRRRNIKYFGLASMCGRSVRPHVAAVEY
ncbi:hypothetical protein EVAR_49365_1 [Eumeta japonica]|uniref:Uncharacterized protein n=1 Tax=Eumeta variegata TaxID=151549 RepID=A0A4C1XUA6_EUMVA|nr:hypothetical protein EVAR_49365_1 [Eumeta japonica]